MKAKNLLKPVVITRRKESLKGVFWKFGEGSISGRKNSAPNTCALRQLRPNFGLFEKLKKIGEIRPLTDNPTNGFSFRRISGTKITRESNQGGENNREFFECVFHLNRAFASN